MTWQKFFFNKLFKQGNDLVVLKRTPALHDLFLESASYGYDSYTMHVPRMYGVGFYAFDEKYKNDHDFLEDDRVKSIFKINVSDDEYFYKAEDNMREIMFDEDTESRFDVCSFYLKMIDLLFEKYNTKEIKPLLINIFNDFCELMFGENYDDIDKYFKTAMFIEKPTKHNNILTLKYNLIRFIKSSYLNKNDLHNNNYSYIDNEYVSFDEDYYQGFEEKFWSEIYHDEDDWHYISVSDFCRNLERYPSEIVMESWSVSTRTAGVVYSFHKDEDWNPSYGYEPRGQNSLLVFLVINSKLINEKFVDSVSYIPEFKKEDKLPDNLVSVSDISEIRDMIGSESLEMNTEILNQSGIRPNMSKDKLISAYIADKEIIGWAWATRNIRDNDEYSFDIVVLPQYSNLGLGKKLICDSIVYIVDNAIEKEEKGKFKVNVINPYLVGYLRKLGFDLSIDLTIKNKYRRNYLEADLNNSEQIEKILSNCC